MELKKNKNKGRLLTPRRALMAAGAGILAIALAKGGFQREINQSQEAFDFNPITAREEILKVDPEAKTNLGGQLDISFTQGPRYEVYPRIRTSPRMIHPRDSESYNGITLSEIKAINGTAVEPNPGVELEIDNYTTVTGDDADNGLTPGAEGTWAALVLTKDDGSETLGFISLSDQTAPNWDVEPGGQTVELKTQEKLPKNFNKVTIIKH